MSEMYLLHCCSFCLSSGRSSVAQLHEFLFLPHAIGLYRVVGIFIIIAFPHHPKHDIDSNPPSDDAGSTDRVDLRLPGDDMTNRFHILFLDLLHSNTHVYKYVSSQNEFTSRSRYFVPTLSYPKLTEHGITEL